MYYTNNVFAENCGIIGSIPPHPQGAGFPLTNIMKLQPALKAIRKNPNLLLQRKGVVYYVDQTPRSCNDKPKSVSIYHGEGASSWEHGFAWASSKDSKELSVGYQDLMSNDWELLDGENILVSHVLAWEFPRSYVEKYDGSVWTASTAYPVSRGYAAGTGTQTAAMVAGGNTYTPAVNFFNGSTWTSSTAAPAGLQAANLVGTQAGAIYWGGGESPGPYPAGAYLWTGSAWTA